MFALVAIRTTPRTSRARGEFAVELIERLRNVAAIAEEHFALSREG